jgi:hypothetical protein
MCYHCQASVAFATHCLQLAKVAADRQSRAVLREMAAEWLGLVEVTRACPQLADSQDVH